MERCPFLPHMDNSKGGIGAHLTSLRNLLLNSNFSESLYEWVLVFSSIPTSFVEFVVLSNF